jgi:hypothetical protein
VILDDGQRCPNYKYTIQQIIISIKCFLGSSAGFRGLSNVFQTLKTFISSIATPVHTTIRQWLLKIGLHKLERPKYSSQGWFFIIDTSIQMGSQKCVVVLGIRAQSVRENFCPNFDHIEPLVIKPLDSCPGTVIKGILEEAITKAGRPLAVISDSGSELKKGVKLLETEMHLFDVSHKINICLKAELESDEFWKAFQKSAGESVSHLKLTPLAHLSPPRQRTKARMHSAFSLIEWGLRLSNYVGSEEYKKMTFECKDKIVWIEQYQNSLVAYKALMEISQKALQLVHERGYYRGIADEFILVTEELSLTDLRCYKFREKVAIALNDEGKKVPDGQHYLGSSEIIESLFGRFKEMEDHHATSGLTSLVLAIAALAGKIDETDIVNAMTTISQADLDSWYEENMGPTFLSKRRKSLQEVKATEEGSFRELDLDMCDFQKMKVG